MSLDSIYIQCFAGFLYYSNCIELHFKFHLVPVLLVDVLSTPGQETREHSPFHRKQSTHFGAVRWNRNWLSVVDVCRNIQTISFYSSRRTNIHGALISTDLEYHQWHRHPHYTWTSNVGRYFIFVSFSSFDWVVLFVSSIDW